MKFGIFYEHQLPRPWDDGSELRADPGRARPGRARRQARHRVRVGGRAPLPRGVLALLRARGVPRRGQPAHQEHPPRPRHHPDRAGLQPPGPHRRARRDARPRVERPGRVRLGRVVVARPSSAASASIRCYKRETWLEGLEVAIRCMTETPFTGVDGKFVPMPPRNVVPKPVQKPHPPLWVACSRRDTILLAAEKGIGALTFAFIDPEEADALGRRLRATLAEKCVAGRPGRQPAGRVRDADDVHHDEDEAIARGLEGAQLLRLLARPLLRVRRARARRDRRVGRVQRAARQMGYSPEAAAKALEEERSAPRSPPATRPASAARSARPTSSASTCALRGGRRRPADLRACRPARTATSTSWSRSSCSGPRCCPSSRSATRSRSPPRRSASSRSSRRCWPARSGVDARPRRLHVPGAAAEVGRRHGLGRDEGVVVEVRRGPRPRQERRLARHRRVDAVAQRSRDPTS